MYIAGLISLSLRYRCLACVTDVLLGLVKFTVKAQECLSYNDTSMLACINFHVPACGFGLLSCFVHCTVFH